jgi:hypothetical protein
MKVGDLVTLSSKGNTLKGNKMFIGGVGIVMLVYEGQYYDFGVRWFPKKGFASNKVTWFKRYEIKKLKPDKKCP